MDADFEWLTSSHLLATGFKWSVHSHRPTLYLSGLRWAGLARPSPGRGRPRVDAKNFGGNSESSNSRPSVKNN